MNLIFIVFITLASPAPLPVVESPPSHQLLEDAQVFLDGLGLIPPMGYSPSMMREDSLPLRSPPLSRSCLKLRLPCGLLPIFPYLLLLQRWGGFLIILVFYDCAYMDCFQESISHPHSPVPASTRSFTAVGAAFSSYDELTAALP